MEDKKICIKCKKRETRDNYSYCNICYNKYKRNWYKKYDGYYIYRFKDELDFTLYIGATKNYYNRLHKHLSLSSHIAREIATYNWDVLEFSDLTDKLQDIKELLIIENILIEEEEPAWNKNLNDIKDVITKERKEELIELANNLKWNFYRKNEYKKNAFKCWEH